MFLRVLLTVSILSTSCISKYYYKKVNTGDIDLLTNIISAECLQCDSLEKSLVGSVIINRIFSEDFPNSMREVIFDKDQFHGINNPQFKYDCESYVIATKLILGCNRNTEILYFYKGDKPKWVSKIVLKQKYHNFGK